MQDDRTPAEVPLRLRIGWGLGSMPMSTLSLVSNVLLMRYMTDSLGIAAATAGVIFTIGRLWDAIADPLIGGLTDRVRTRFGRRLPWMLAGGLLTPVLLVALYAAPTGDPVKASLYLAVMLVLFATFYTMFMVPYLALPAEMTENYHGRTQLMSARVVFSSLGSFLGLGVGPWLLAAWGGVPGAHLHMAMVLAAIALVLVLVCLWSLRDVPLQERPPATRTPLGAQIRSALSNRPFAWLMASKCAYFIALSLTLNALPFMSKHVLALSDRWLGTMLTVQSVAVIASQPLWLWVSRRSDKRRGFVLAGIAYAIGCLSWWFAGHGEPESIATARMIFVGVAGGGVFLMTQAMLPDAIDADRYRTGERRAGMFTGVYVLVEKFAGAVGGAFAGAFLGALGYLHSTEGHAVVQPESALLGIRLCASVLPALMLGVALLAIRGYDVDSRMLARLREQEAPAR